jgi:mannose-6-phosphate isomerase
LVYEVQQPSAITYRLDDWGRVDAAGNPREMHIEQGLAVTIPTYRPEVIPPVSLASTVGRRYLLVACRYFALEWMALAAGREERIVAPGSPHVVTCLRGAIHLWANGVERMVGAGGTAALLAASGDGRIRAVSSAILLHAWVPDLARDIVGPARAAGASDEALTRLAGPLDDIHLALPVPS